MGRTKELFEHMRLQHYSEDEFFYKKIFYDTVCDSDDEDCDNRVLV